MVSPLKSSPDTPVHISDGLLAFFYVVLVCSILMFLYLCYSSRSAPKRFNRTESVQSRRNTIVNSRMSSVQEE